MIFENSPVRIGHGKIINGFQNTDGSIDIFVSSGDVVMQKQMKLSKTLEISVGDGTNKFSMSEIVPLGSTRRIGRLGRNIKIFS